MKSHLLFFFLLCSLSVNCQYKRFTFGAFAVTNNFDSHKFYSSPGASLQFNFRKIFSVSIAANKERLTESTSTYNDIQFYNSYSKLNLNYWNVPVSVKASFGKKLLFFCEAGSMFHLDYMIHSEGYTDYTYDPDSNSDFSYDYPPQDNPLLLLYAGGGLNYPVTKNLLLQFSASRSFRKYREENTNHIFINETFSYSPGFVQFKFQLGVFYNLNFLKNSKYSFTTYYPHFEKN